MKRISKTFRLHPKLTKEIEKLAEKEDRSEAKIAERSMARDLKVKLND